MIRFDFRKSSYSNGTPSGECVEVATNIRTTVAIRDPKDPSGPSLLLPSAAWRNFLTSATVVSQ
ncbi:DUF397 domain-containing protein [Streptomyces xiamenensis]|uniref:DUF397 domain-containing protein n=1 Tax=Streptomyces xiamenensis TaxID=408015 RepID=UPI0037D8FF5D